MHPALYSIECDHWQPTVTSEKLVTINTALEEGKILHLPTLQFSLEKEEKRVLTPDISDGKSKNISFNINNGQLQGLNKQYFQNEKVLKVMLQRYAEHSLHLLHAILPKFTSSLILGRTSFRPVEIAGRKSPSYKKDDTRLHVDAFPANPNQGRRILRLFTNINPLNQTRHWRVGQPFQSVAEHFLPHIRMPLRGSQFLLKALGITKTYRSLYDHIMLQIHDRMKGNEVYQKNVKKHEVAFNAGSSWIVFTDQVSHAVLAGQFVLEQTFYLPVEGMQTPQKSPLRILEALCHKKLT